MKQVKTVALLFLSLMFMERLFAQTNNTEQLTVPLSNPGKAYSLKLRTIDGSIKITGYSGKDILVEVNAGDSKNKKDGGNNTSLKKLNAGDESSNGMKKITASGSYEITAKESDNDVTISSSNPSRRLNLSLKIPQDVKIKVSSVNGGNIEIEGVKGELEVSHTNGSIKLNNISGSVVANTTNGNITTVFTTIDAKAPMAFSTFHGNIDVTLPVTTKANLKLNSERGDIYSDFDIDIDKTQPQVNTTKEPGTYKIKKDNAVFGKINGGGAEISLKTYNGNIYVKKAGSKA